MRPVTAVGVAVLATSVGLLACATAPRVGRAGGQGDLSKLALSSKPVTIQFQNAELPDVLQFLGRAAGIPIRLAPDVHMNHPVNVRFTNAKFEDVFNFLLTAANLSYRVIDAKTVLVTTRTDQLPPQ